MSVNGVEQILWEICNVPERTIEMREHPDQFVRDKGLNEEEQRMVRQLDVRGLAGYQVNQMLIMMTWNILNGADRFPDYVNQLVGTAPAASQTSIGRVSDMANIVGGFLVPHVPLVASHPELPPLDKRTAVAGGYAHLAQRLDELKVDTLLIVGDDHYTIFSPRCLPRCLIGIGDVEGPVEPWLGIKRQMLKTDTDLAQHIMNVGFDRGVDWAVSKSLLLDHSVMVPYHFSGSDAAGRSVIPIYLSCAVEPLLSSARARAIGAITGEAIRSFGADRNVAILGTGGLSHWVGMARMGDVNQEWDRKVLDLVEARDIDALVAMADDDIIREAGNGALEIKNWIFAMSAVGAHRSQLISYTAVNEWVAGFGFVECLAA